MNLILRDLKVVVYEGKWLFIRNPFARQVVCEPGSSPTRMLIAFVWFKDKDKHEFNKKKCGSKH